MCLFTYILRIKLRKQQLHSISTIGDSNLKIRKSKLILNFETNWPFLVPLDYNQYRIF